MPVLVDLSCLPNHHRRPPRALRPRGASHSIDRRMRRSWRAFASCAWPQSCLSRRSLSDWAPIKALSRPLNKAWCASTRFKSAIGARRPAYPCTRGSMCSRRFCKPARRCATTLNRHPRLSRSSRPRAHGWSGGVPAACRSPARRAFPRYSVGCRQAFQVVTVNGPRSA